MRYDTEINDEKNAELKIPINAPDMDVRTPSS